MGDLGCPLQRTGRTGAACGAPRPLCSPVPAGAAAAQSEPGEAFEVAEEGVPGPECLLQEG